MKAFVLSLLVILASTCSGDSSSAATAGNEIDPPTAASKKAVLVELFTSEGCSSCPPAEANLAYLQKEQPVAEADIITLAFHVDYWDGLGWKDPFATPLFTQRQRVYDRKFRTGNIYTPQMVVDGDIEFVGSKRDKAEKAIRRSVESDKAEIDLSFEADSLSVKITNLPKLSDATVYLAIAEDGLSSDVERGENAGKELTHLSVVRSLSGIGRVTKDDGTFSFKGVPSVGSDWDGDNLKAIVFIQENSDRRVHGAASIGFPAVKRQ